MVDTTDTQSSDMIPWVLDASTRYILPVAIRDLSSRLVDVIA